MFDITVLSIAILITLFQYLHRYWTWLNRGWDLIDTGEHF